MSKKLEALRQARETVRPYTTEPGGQSDINQIFNWLCEEVRAQRDKEKPRPLILVTVDSDTIENALELDESLTEEESDNFLEYLTNCAWVSYLAQSEDKLFDCLRRYWNMYKREELG